MEEPKPLSFEKQIDLFEARGVVIGKRDIAVRHIRDIGYYKLKSFSLPLSRVDENKERIYTNVTFQDILNRFYADKNLRISLLHSIEDIEVSIKTKLAYILGEKGAYYYLNFANWCNREKYCKYYLEDKQKDLKHKIYNRMQRSSSIELRDKKNLKNNKYPTIWLLVEILTFGDIVELLDLMSNKNLKVLSDYYNCTPEQLKSWLKSLKFIRNNCAHNSMVIDIKLKTSPTMLEEWKEFLYVNQKNEVTSRLAIILCIIKKMMLSINPDYNFGKIYGPIKTLLNTSSNREQAANLIGFTSADAFVELFPKKKKKTYKIKHDNKK
ncbi:Abi family protein [Lactococcus petauri]|uniref:Abi family protein n=1 Tax=Lactococcus petauri TaxID=1940789 RepID=UPI0038519E91